jgi:site-specific DNA recombinase
MKVLGYIRVSSNIQIKGYSLVLQKNKIKEYCKLMDLELIEVYEDRGISGMSIDKRNGYKGMIEYLENNEIDGVIVWSLSRLGRKMTDIVGFLDELKKKKKKFFSIKENINNEDKIGGLIMNILSSINEFEVEVIRERIRDVKREKKKNFLVYGNDVYGWDKLNGKLVKNESEFKIIRRVKRLRKKGLSWKNISCVLNKEGVKSKKGGIWYDGSLFNMMKNYY